MALHKLHAGDGYTYLTRQVAAGDEGRTPGQQLADYYTASGNPPGRWVGAGAADLAVTGRVREDQMRALFGRGMHPDAEQIVALETAAGVTPTDAAQAAKLGRAFPQYKPLPPRAERVSARLSAWKQEHGQPPSQTVRSKIEVQEARKDRRAVAGYDLVFTPVKSASLLWALGSSSTRQAVEDAHHEAVADTLAWLEVETAFARVGDAGEQQIETRGFVATAFDHRDSRAGDPDLHTHLAISNKVRARHDHPDGRPRWLSLDARVLHAAAVAASERYNTRFEDALARRLEVEFVNRADTVRRDKRVVREIAGVPDALIKHFSKRRAAVEDRYRTLSADYRRAHSHEPPRTTQLKLAQQATLETRDTKAAPTSLAERLTGWRDEAAAVLGARSGMTAARDIETAAVGRPVALAAVADVDIAQVARSVVTIVSEEKATWTRWNVLAETERQLRPLRFANAHQRQDVTDLVLDQALSPGVAVQLTSNGLELDPDSEMVEPPSVPRRSDGESVLHEHGATRYTTQDLLDAEQRLLDHAAQPTRLGMTPARVTDLLQGFEQRHNVKLDSGQRALVHGFTTDPQRLTVGIGPAGAGKTTAMQAVAAVWRTTGHRVIPLAPSATAAEVLGGELGCRAENLHKFRHTHETAPTGRPDDPWFALDHGDLVLVDEASLAGTRNLDWLTTYARERGALVRLLGDPAQIGSVEAGGMLRLLAHDAGAGAVELTDLHRFTNPHEAAATLDIREGRPEAVAFYKTHDRICSGSNDAMLDAAYNAWHHDTGAGLTSLLIAQTSADVTALNTRARAARVATGDVDERGVDLHDGTTAGRGDTITTRRNNRHLTNREGSAFVKNGDTWTITKLHRNGDLTVQAPNHPSKVRLPADYVAKDVELGYAITAARAQGRTVDTVHALVDDSTSRAGLYVAATRGRDGAHLYVTTERLLPLDPERPPTPSRDPSELLGSIVVGTPQELTATETQRAAAASRQPAGPVAPRRAAYARPYDQPTWISI